MRFAAERPDVLDFFRRTKMPDEPSSRRLLSSPLADSVENGRPALHGLERGSAHPGPARGRPPQAQASGKLFARKFDASWTPEILDLVDREPAGAA